MAQAQEAAAQAREQAQQGVQQAKDTLRDQVGQRSTQAGEQIATQADDVRSVADQLRTQGKDTPAQLIEQAADYADRLGGYLRDADTDRILSDVEDYARRNPWAVVAGGLVVGFAASRLLRSSTRSRSSSDQFSRTALPPAGQTTDIPAPTPAPMPTVPPTPATGAATGTPRVGNGAGSTPPSQPVGTPATSEVPPRKAGPGAGDAPTGGF